MNQYDVIVIGGGAAGLFCAANISKDKNVLLLEANTSLGRKILISGGGRCNFTNIHSTFNNYYSENLHFSKSPFSQFKSDDFVKIVESYKIPFYEKKLGQLFCETSAKEIVNLLIDLCKKNNVEIRTNSKVLNVNKSEELFTVTLGREELTCFNVVIATGGLSIPNIGANDIGYRIAKSFKHTTTDLYPALVPFCLREEDSAFWHPELAGISLDVEASVNKKKFEDGLLFTHKGLSGPVILKVSLYWNKGDIVKINLCPEHDVKKILFDGKNKTGQTIGQALKGILPSRLLECILEEYLKVKTDRKLAEMANKNLEEIASLINDWKVRPYDTEGYRKAEVTRGGVSTQELSSKSLESKNVKGLYFIGEVVDVTGELGGHNFQWAWASAYSCAKNINSES